MYKLKRNANGNILRHKARLVAKGFRQRAGINYQETYSPVRFDSIRAVLATAYCENLHIKQFDVKTAFLYEDIKETTLYMQQPQGYNDGIDSV